MNSAYCVPKSLERIIFCVYVKVICFSLISNLVCLSFSLWLNLIFEQVEHDWAFKWLKFKTIYKCSQRNRLYSSISPLPCLSSSQHLASMGNQLFYFCWFDILYLCAQYPLPPYTKENKLYSLLCALFFSSLTILTIYLENPCKHIHIFLILFCDCIRYSAVLLCCCCLAQNMQFCPFCLCLYPSSPHGHLRLRPLLKLSSWAKAENARYSWFPEDSSHQPTCLSWRWWWIGTAGLLFALSCSPSSWAFSCSGGELGSDEWGDGCGFNTAWFYLLHLFPSPSPGGTNGTHFPLVLI